MACSALRPHPSDSPVRQAAEKRTSNGSRRVSNVKVRASSVKVRASSDRRRAAGKADIARAKPDDCHAKPGTRREKPTSRMRLAGDIYWRDGRVVDYTGLENRHTATYRGFESLSLRSTYKQCTRICTRKRPILTLSGVFYAHFPPDFILRCTRMYKTPSFSMVHHVFGVQSCTFPRSAEFSAHEKSRGATPRPTIIVRGATPRFATMTVQRYAFYFRNPRIRVMKLRMTRTNGCLFKYRSKTAATMTATMNAM